MSKSDRKRRKRPFSKTETVGENLHRLGAEMYIAQTVATAHEAVLKAIDEKIAEIESEQMLNSATQNDVTADPVGAGLGSIDEVEGLRLQRVIVERSFTMAKRTRATAEFRFQSASTVDLAVLG